jgi:hypothetical protein
MNESWNWLRLKLAALQAAEAQIAQERDRRDDLAATFEAVAALLRELEATRTGRKPRQPRTAYRSMI